MKKFLLSSPFLIALLLGGYSSYLAYKGEYEAAMAGAGVSVALATSRRDDKENDTMELHTEIRHLEAENGFLKEQQRKTSQELALANQLLTSQGIIKEKEVEIAILKTKNEMLSQQQEVRYLSESKTSFVNIESSEKQIVENFEENDD